MSAGNNRATPDIAYTDSALENGRSPDELLRRACPVGTADRRSRGCFSPALHRQPGSEAQRRPAAPASPSDGGDPEVPPTLPRAAGTAAGAAAAVPADGVTTL